MVYIAPNGAIYTINSAPLSKHRNTSYDVLLNQLCIIYIIYIYYKFIISNYKSTPISVDLYYYLVCKWYKSSKRKALVYAVCNILIIKALKTKALIDIYYMLHVMLVINYL